MDVVAVERFHKLLKAQAFDQPHFLAVDLSRFGHDIPPINPDTDTFQSDPSVDAPQSNPFVFTRSDINSPMMRARIASTHQRTSVPRDVRIGHQTGKVGNLEPSVLASLDVLLSPIKEVETEDLAADLNTRERRSAEGKTTNLPKQEEFMDMGVVFKRLERWVVVVVDSISLSLEELKLKKWLNFGLK
ncbi:hypothetical protein LWI29_018868 [Acer saccharum]|uniref:Uncharacterized protein n=1 Tax=Acer saccharum TaxID=4024 RepID=A0AA39VLV0_ACESA|nr:hypothetical protein LWI29_018868 [Acer saccharum]